MSVFSPSRCPVRWWGPACMRVDSWRLRSRVDPTTYLRPYRDVDRLRIVRVLRVGEDADGRPGLERLPGSEGGTVS